MCVSKCGGGYKTTFERQFYTKTRKGRFVGSIYGFPIRKCPWCVKVLKSTILTAIAKKDLRDNVLSQEAEWKNLWIPDNGRSTMVHIGTEAGKFSNRALVRGADISIVQYIGIAADEPERIQRNNKPGYALPLVEAGWSEADCKQWCEENSLLSPVYTTSTRGGCWFCHNQSVDQLRQLRKNYPDLWALLLKWDKDSPYSFKPDGHTVHDYDRRFSLEDQGRVPCDRRFRWKMLDDADRRGRDERSLS